MDRIKAQTLAEVIKEIFAEKKGEDFLDEMRVIDSWKSIVGDYTASHTTDLSIRDGVLYACIDSAALRNELAYSKSVLVRNLNAVAGRDLLKDIIFR